MADGVMARAAGGVAAGVVGTLALDATSGLERWLLGREPSYAPARIARRLLGGGWPWGPGRRTARRLGQWMRWAYGPGLGLVYGLARPWLRGSGVRRGVTLGVGVLAFEALAMPAVGAVPPLSRWPRRELALLAAHTVLFGLFTEMTLFVSRRAGR